MAILDEVWPHCAREGDVRHRAVPPPAISKGPIQTIIPWATNLYTETLIQRVRASLARISGASGCSAACPAAAWVLFSTRAQAEKAQTRLQES
jgi:hypothetical protein